MECYSNLPNLKQSSPETELRSPSSLLYPMSEIQPEHCNKFISQNLGALGEMCKTKPGRAQGAVGKRTKVRWHNSGVDGQSCCNTLAQTSTA